MNSLIQSVFKDRSAFIAYLTGGDGGVQYSVEVGLALIEGGVDILEIGIPFSDPIADGPTIQKAHERALREQTTPETVLEIASQIKKVRPHIPLILFSYFNPILQMGDSFLPKAKRAGFDGALLLDLPCGDPYFNGNSGLDPIHLLSPSTSTERLEEISARGRGFLYYACQKGTTGVRRSLPTDLKDEIQRIKRVTSTPVVVGFGIAERCVAAEVVQMADGFVVGSAFVKMIEAGARPEDLKIAAQRIDPRNIKGNYT